MPFISNTDEQRKQMLEEIGAASFEELLKGIPKELIIRNPLELDEPLSEFEITKKVRELAAQNINTSEVVSFLGAGIYDHFIPAAVGYVTGRPEFYSAYTPYQAEVSQGTLQFIYEYQTLICELTGMDASNASMYDGATACAEALLLALRHNKNKKVIISSLIHPHYKQVIETYIKPLEPEIVYIPQNNGRIDMNELQAEMSEDVSAVLIPSPNFLGVIEDLEGLEPVIHENKKAIFIVSTDPISLLLFNPPGRYNIDVVVGEGQVLGSKQNLGGPLFGFFAVNQKLIRKMPGRIVGATVDTNGQKGYVLTLQAREQHIRRDKATSNICTNESLCALAATVYMVLMGREGLREVAEQSTIKAHYLHDKICNIDGFEPSNTAPFFKEFAVKTPIPPSEIISQMKHKGYFAGVDISQYGYDNQLLLAVTEKRTRQELDTFVDELEKLVKAV
jgi:glycine dehydrogenase subunit 1